METLRERIKRCGPLGAIRIARQITSALVAAHAKRIVHRDLKPSNIMIVPDPDMVGGERAVLVGLRVWRHDSSKAPAAPAVRKVLWIISSTPAGAEVLSEFDGQVRGRTPLRREQPAADGSQRLVLRHPDYAELPFTLDRSASSELSLTLSPLPVARALPKPPWRT